MSIAPGTRLAIDENTYTVINGDDPTNVEIKCNENNELYRKNLLNKIDSGSLVSTLDSESQGISRTSAVLSLDDARYERAHERFSTIVTLTNLQHRSKKDVEEAAKRAGVTARSIYSWMRKYENKGFKGLVTPDTFGGRAKIRTDQVCESILQRIIGEHYQGAQHTKKTAIYSLFQQQCYKSGIREYMSYRTVVRRLENIDRQLDVEARLGKARDKWPNSSTRGFADKEFLLQTIQVDHTPLDIIVIDEDTGQVIGRPWLTLAIDVYSRCVWGYYLGFQHPNADTVGLAILNGAFKKKQLVDLFHLSDWPVFGRPYQIHTDNGMDFRSTALEKGCSTNNIDMMRRPVKTPEYGAYIERLFGTINKFVHTLPGTTFSSIQQRGDYDSAKHACLSIKELERCLLEYIVDQYHHTLHSKLGMTPLQKWEQGLEKASGTPMAPIEPPDSRRFRQDFLPPVEPDGKRKIEDDGVHNKGLVFWAGELGDLQRENGLDTRYWVKFDPTDTGYLFILDERHDLYYTLMSNSRSTPPISWRQREAARKELKAQGSSAQDETMVIEAGLRIRERIAGLAISSKKARRIIASEERERQIRTRTSPPAGRASDPKSLPEPDFDPLNLSKKIDLALDEGEER